MAYLNKIDINGRTYYLQHLTDGKNEAMLPTPVKDDQLLLRSQVVNSVTSKESQSGSRVPLSAYQGYSLNAKLNQEILDREADVDEEQARAEAAELVLTNNLNQEIQDRISDVDAEETRAMAAEKVLTDNLAQEVIDRTNDVNEEQQRAENAEKVLTDNLNKEIQDRIDDINAEEARALAVENEIKNYLTKEIHDRAKDVDAEEERALAAEKVLTDNLAQEIVDRTNAIATEKSRAEGIETDHESRIATMETFFKEADIDASKEFIDTLKEIQTYIADDKTGAAAMSASIQANKTAIGTEAGRAKGVEADLQSKITAEATTARAAEKANADAIAVLNGSANGSVAKAVSDARTALESEIAKKVDKVDGKGLSDQNYTADEKAKLDGIETGANKYIHPSYDVCTSGLYKITVDEYGHVSSVVAVTKEDIVGLGIPAQDTTYDDTITSLQEQIDALKALVESYHPVVEPEPEPEETE